MFFEMILSSHKHDKTFATMTRLIAIFGVVIKGDFSDFFSLTCGKVSNFAKSMMEQKSWRLMLEVIMSRHMVNRTRLPSFFPGPKILMVNSSSIGEPLISRTTRRTYREIT